MRSPKESIVQFENEEAEKDLEKQGRQFFYWVGLAVTQWARIDEELFSICAAVLKADQRHVAIIYYRTPSLEARISLTNDLAKTVMPQRKRKNGGHASPFERKWDKLIQDIKDALRIRNQLAHSPVGGVLKFVGSDNSDPYNTVLIAEPHYASFMSEAEKLRGKDTKDDITIGGIIKHVRLIGEFIDQLKSFRHNDLSKLV
jgi:hypothetical protein